MTDYKHQVRAVTLGKALRRSHATDSIRSGDFRGGVFCAVGHTVGLGRLRRLRQELRSLCHTLLSASLRHLLPTAVLPVELLPVELLPIEVRPLEVLPKKIVLPTQPLRPPFALPALLPAGVLCQLRWLQRRTRFRRSGRSSRRADSRSRSAVAQRRPFDSLSGSRWPVERPEAQAGSRATSLAGASGLGLLRGNHARLQRAARMLP